MLKKHLTLPISIFCLSSSHLVQAEEATAEKTWNTAAELGYIKTSGNTDTETLNTKLKAETTYTKWTHQIELEALKSVSNDVRSAEKYRVEGQSDFALSERTYAFGVTNWENDNFSGLNYQASIASGLGYKAIHTSEIKLNLELAPGYRKTEDENNNTEENGIVRAAEIFSWKINKSSTFDQYLKVESGESNTETRFGVALTSQVAGDLSMKVSYNVTHNSDVLAGIEKTDRETAITLVYKI